MMIQGHAKVGVARWAVAGFGLALVAALVFTVISSSSSAERSSQLVERGQGGTLARALRAEIIGLGAEPSQADLNGLVETYADLGLRAVVILDRRGQPKVSGGDVQTPPQPPPQRPDELIRLGGDRLRIYGRLPPKHRRGEFGPGRGRRGPDNPGRKGPTLLMIDFEPTMAQQLRSEARRTLTVGLATALALLLAGAYLWRLLKQREAMERGLEQKRRLAALGEMSAVMAHEIRNPLASLKGHTQLLTELLAPDTRERTKAERVLTEALRLEQLTSDLLDFVKPQTLARTPVDPAALLRECAEAVQHPDIDLVLEAAPKSWSLDSPRFGRVLTNLLTNAAQACPEGTIHASVTCEGAQAIFVVRDEGEGIEEGREKAIFEPFNTNRVRGTGLGLAIAQRIVEAHGGAISARNHPDGGAEFRVAIPDS